MTGEAKGGWLVRDKVRGVMVLGLKTNSTSQN
jgi:hypothetical protein